MTLAKHVFVRPRTARALRRVAGGVLRLTLSFVLVAASVALGPVSVAQAATPGYYIAGDGSGGGAAGDYSTDYGEIPNGGAGGGDADTLVGTSGDDVIFGDGSGGGGGGSNYRDGAGGAGGGGADTITGGAGDDIVFGDGFTGMPRVTVSGGNGGFGGGGGGGGAWNPNGNGGNGGILGGGGGTQTGSTLGTSLYGGGSGGISSKPVGGTSTDDNRWGGFSATPTGGSGWFAEQSMGGSAYNSFGAGGGAGFGGANSQTQWITSGVTRMANGGRGQGGVGQAGSTTPVRYDDTSGNLWSYVYGQRANIFSSASGTTNGVGAGADTIDGGAGSDELFGLGGDDVFVFNRDEAGSSDIDTVWDFNRLAESDELELSLDGRLIYAAERDVLIAAQTTSGNDRTIVFSDGGSHSVTIIVKSIGRDLAAGDFDVEPAVIPTVVTAGVSDVTSATATSGGSVTASGGVSVTARGVCWSTSASPTVSDAHTTDESGTGSFTSSITGLSTNTRYYVRAYATNSEGTGYGSDVSFYYDTGAPSTTEDGLSGSSSTGWVNATPTVTFTATDTLSGVDYTQYAVDGGGWTTYTAPVSIGGADGSHPVTYRSADESGNVEATNTGYVNMDTVAPSLTATAPTGWQTSAPVTATASAEDTMSGLAGIRYSVNGAVATTYSAGVAVSAQGTTTLGFAALDDATNQSATSTLDVRIDSIAPTTTATGLETAAGDSWQTGATLFSLSADDAASGVSATTYTVDAGVGQLYTGAVAVTGEGTHTITYASEDVAGNVEATHTGYINIDSDAPTLTVDAPSSWQTTSPVSVSAEASDSISGLAGIRYSVNGAAATTYTAAVEVSTQGTTTLGFAALDVAGNRSATETVEVHLDTIDPVTTATGLAATAGELWHTSSTWPFSLSATDSASGVWSISYRLDSGSGELYTVPVLVTGEGTHTVEYGAVDVAGNVETTQTGYINIDSNAPTTTLTGLTDSVWRTTNATATLSASDTISGVEGTRYSLNGGAATTYTVPFELSTEGTTTIGYCSVDVAGNVEASHTLVALIDRTAPSSTATAPSGWTSVPATVTISVSDAVSGVEHTYYRLNGEATQTYSGAFAVTDEGTTTVSYWSVDVAGNVESTQTLEVRASEGPVTTIDVPGEWVSDDVTVTVDATGPVPVESLMYRIGSGVMTTYTAPFSVTDEGTTLISACSTDTNGSSRGEVTATVRIDRTAPVTTDNHVATYLGSATIHMSAVDTLSGPDFTRYSLDSGAVTTGTAVTVSTAGAHTLAYASTDAAGNTEATKTITFTVTAAKTTYNTRMALTGPSSAKRRRSFAVKVWTAPRIARGYVRLTIQRKVGGRWRTAKVVSTRIVNGRGSYSFKPGYRGSWRITSRYAGGTTATAVYRPCSATKYFRVR